MNKQKKRSIAIFLFFLIVIINNILAQSTNINDYTKNYPGENTNEKNIQKFIDLSSEDKNKVWEESRTLKFSGEVERDLLSQQAIQKIYKDRLKKDLAVGAEKMIIRTLGSILYQEMEKEGVFEQLGIKIDNIDQLKDLAKKAGKDIDVVLATQIESVEGFGSKDLAWSTKGKNIIGNGKTYLNVDKLPYGVNSIKYDESKKVFILKTKDGGELVLGEGATNENGNVNMLSSLTEKSPLRTALAPFADPKKPLGLENFIIIGDKGQVVLGKDNIEIKGDGIKVKYGEFVFGRKQGEKSATSIVKFYEDEFIMKGIEFKREGYVRVGSTDYEFTVNFESNPNNVAYSKKNFLNMYGENSAVGGKGNIEVLRNLNSLRGFDCNGFRVKAGDIDLSFKENGVYKGNKNSFKNSFTIDNIYTISDEKPVEYPFKIVKSADGTYKFEAANFIAGKITALGKYGTSVDVSLVVDKKDLGKIKEKVQGAWFFPKSSLVESLKDSSFSYNIDMYAPFEGTASMNPDSKIKNEVIIPELRDMLSKALVSKVINPKLNDPKFVEIFGNRQLSQETNNLIDSLTQKFISQVQASRVGSGKYSFKITNNPGYLPTISVLMPGNKENTMDLDNNENSLIKDILDISLIIPDIGSTAYHVRLLDKDVPKWPADHLKELWYRYLGQKPSSTSAYLPVKDDLDLIKEFLNKRTTKKND
ncbi:MAG: hypothetical protein Q8N99_06915 [Nanoarchaeota archaeon]|nr:hypothetical protein [Nanoarchaeota archaeon]